MYAKIVEWWEIIEPYAGFLGIVASILGIIGGVIWVIQKCRSIIDNRRDKKRSNEVASKDSTDRWQVMIESEHVTKSRIIRESSEKRISEVTLKDSTKLMIESEHATASKDMWEQYGQNEANRSWQTNKGERTMRKLSDWMMREAIANRGLNYHDRGDFDKAIEYYSELIRNNPDDCDLYFWRARAYREAALKEKRQTEQRHNTAKSDDYFQNLMKIIKRH